ncbi:hypothetical protein BU24DRAFT_317747, partial [Aaosphaeria arxii CBS 175.79]
LSPEQLEEQLLAIDLVLSMFSLPGEIERLESTQDSAEQLRRYIEDPASSTSQLPSSIDLTINLSIEAGHEVQLHVHFPLEVLNDSKIEADSTEPPPPVISFRCPSWMNRKSHAEIVRRLPVQSPDPILTVVDFLKEEVAKWLTSSAASTDPGELGQEDQALMRVWFYLQSLSTRSKRDDMVNWAPNYGLTGFVLAGKPGILCLEGTSSNISAYMSEIKTRSWSDIPPHQKKISERHREEGQDVQRVFKEMREVTGEISKGGHRGNRGEMGEVKQMFEQVGLGDIFVKVL